MSKKITVAGIGGAVLVDAEIHRNVAGFYQGDSPPRARRREILRI